MQGSAASQVVQLPLRGRHTIPVGAGPSDLLVVDDGRTLVRKSVKEHALSIIDLSARREVARVRLPVAGKGRKPNRGLSQLGSRRTEPTLWAVSSEGQIFTVDLATGQPRQGSCGDGSVATDLLAVARDQDRARLLIGAQEGAEERGALLAFSSGRL